ncbi:CaiB/BaiF CoA transferase family protein [Sphingomonas sp. M1-B02]|uniref:CaiB/BaiF CoA transferase family protein n=1 Tax=Sphingomonas sp. M1-B02 TaxID=3114300 RepID=UPI00223FC685|nr:CaiB/BaiF CoA-transferase family protein [Sphingomonas sp. S6-11]UZK67012.1 CoA transferase [Sphingomonas sp. S6-11]
MSALAGLKVVDFSKFLPGPYCTWLLADLGAEVIRIENPRELGKQRKVFGWDKLSDEENARLRAHDIFARGKKSVLIDPGSDDGRAAIHKLIESADILVEDYRPGVMASMGYGWPEMTALNPRLIYCSVTLCGQTGPYARKPGHDPVALAIAGALSRIGDHPDRPAFPGVPVADLLSGSNAVIGVLAAVIARATTGKGQQVDIAMSDSSLALIANILSRNPDVAKAPPKGMHRADSGIWACADGLYLVTTDMEPRYWRIFVETIGLSELADRQMDRAGWPAMKERIAAVIETKPRAEWLAILEAAGTQFAPVLTVAEALDDPHNHARGMVLDLPAPGGTVRHTGCPIKLSDTPAAVTDAARPAGADTAAVLATLGYDDAQIAALEGKIQ